MVAFPLLVQANHTTCVSARYCQILATIFVFSFSNFLELETSAMKDEYPFGNVVTCE
jgi:hypothetical protein